MEWVLETENLLLNWAVKHYWIKCRDTGSLTLIDQLETFINIAFKSHDFKWEDDDNNSEGKPTVWARGLQHLHQEEACYHGYARDQVMWEEVSTYNLI